MDISLYSVAVIFSGYFVLGTAGFGSALIIVPLLAWHWPLTFVVPLVLLIDVPAAVLHTGLNFKQVMWRELPPLLPSVLVGALVGMGLIRWT
ncbi:MAG: sulfite exporter TauE/SafE family protein, partial [Betaproteobacteria bacterium]|nr:sulfite exporter TauE/SafE family protein [Betaproteobacteria bacterium]